MIVGFTGSRRGLDSHQINQIKELLSNPEITEVHHGDCRGADETFHRLASEAGKKIVIHPPNSSKMRFNGVGEVLPRKPFLERNKDIVIASDVMIACPESSEEVLRSGTWATIRFSKKTNTHLVLLPFR